jgi:hypothetical protein
MATLALTEDQVMELVKQLPPSAKSRVLKDLNAERDGWWSDLPARNSEAIRKRAIERGLNWDAMAENEREEFVDTLLHES